MPPKLLVNVFLSNELIVVTFFECVSVHTWRVKSRWPGNVKKCLGTEGILLICTCSDRKIFCYYLPSPLLNVVRTWRIRKISATTPPPTESGRLPEMTENVPGAPPNKNPGYAVDAKNSCGYDDISSIFLKRITTSIIKPLTIVINQVLNNGIFPDKLKIAKVVPIFKSGDCGLTNNYRPISLLPVISKVIEKLSIRSYHYISKVINFFLIANIVFDRTVPPSKLLSN